MTAGSFDDKPSGIQDGKPSGIQSGKPSGTLYVVATPIGNAGDITDRAKRTLAEADMVAAEDTRAAGALLKALGIKNKLVSYHKFNEKSRTDFILSQLEGGLDVAVVSDAGTPCVSDPGGAIVRAAAGRGLRVVGVCGASAVTAALCVSGFGFGSFTFHGFLPRAAKDIEKVLEMIAPPQTAPASARALSSPSAEVFFESPMRIIKTLCIFAAAAPSTQICLCNDLTKKYERVYRGSPQQVLDELSQNPSAEKGEYTLVAMFGAEPGVPPHGANTPLTLEAALVDYMAKNGCGAKDAVAALAADPGSGYTKKGLYSASLNLKKMFSLGQ